MILLKRFVLRVLFWAYLPLAVVAAGVVPLGAIGLIRNDPFMTVLALVLGLPWSILLPWLVDTSSGFLNFILLLLALAANGLILRALAKSRRQRRRDAEEEDEEFEDVEEDTEA